MWPTDENRQAWDQRYAARGPGLPDAVRERLPDLAGKHVLHVPAGTGEVAADLMEFGALVSAVDPSDAKLAAARQRAPDAAFFQAELDELPLQLRRHRFAFVYAGLGTLAAARELGPVASALTAALRKNGRLILYDVHPVFACIDPIGLRWRENYFTEGFWRLGQVAVAFGATLDVTALDELPPPRAAETIARVDPRVPTYFLLDATRP